MLTAIERFWRKIHKTETCWIWFAGVTHFGYGSLKFNGRYVNAHRVSWTLHYGEIPPGLLVLHKCDNPRCVNPDHLELGTHGDNLRQMSDRGRTAAQRRTHCPHGHAYDETNTQWIRSNLSGRMIRGCRACILKHGRDKMRRRRAKEKLDRIAIGIPTSISEPTDGSSV